MDWSKYQDEDMRILNDLIKDGILIEVNDDQSKNN